MHKKFHFKVQTQWQKGQLENAKSHVAAIASKVDLQISAAHQFKGDATKHNPEDLLLSALSSCHMMSYFYVCQQHGIDLVDYHDNATGILELRSDLSGGFSRVELNPIVTIATGTDKSLAMDLHKKAHELCFIANSVNFEVVITAVILLE